MAGGVTDSRISGGGAGMSRAPQRIQRKRSKGWKMPPNTVYVGRPSWWGNPFAVGKIWKHQGAKTFYVTEPSHAVQLFREYLKGLKAAQPNWENLIAQLRGKDLACWCPLDQPCHADVLLESANAEPSLTEAERKRAGLPSAELEGFDDE